MDGVLFLIILGVFMGLAGLAAFLWSLQSGQYVDLKGAAERILLEEKDTARQEPASTVDPSNQTQGERVHNSTPHTMVLSRRTRDRIIIALAVLSGIIVLVPSMISAALSVLGMLAGLI